MFTLCLLQRFLRPPLVARSARYLLLACIASAVRAANSIDSPSLHHPLHCIPLSPAARPLRTAKHQLSFSSAAPGSPNKSRPAPRSAPFAWFSLSQLFHERKSAPSSPTAASLSSQPCTQPCDPDTRHTAERRTLSQEGAVTTSLTTPHPRHLTLYIPCPSR